jgi:hypothetical protein
MKWIMRSRRTGTSRKGAGAPMASGAKNWRGSLMKVSEQRLCLEQCKGGAKWAKL